VYSNLKRLLQLSVDSELREVLKTSLPLVLVELVSSLYSLTDTYFISGLGAEALAGLGISMYVLMFLQSAIVLFTTPVLIVVSQSLGAGRLDLARSFLAGVLLVGGVYTTVLGLLSYLFSEPLVVLVSGTRGLALEYSVEYLKLRCLGLIALYTTTALDMTIISTGKTHYSLIANTTGLALNAVLDPLLIYGYWGFPRLEVVGAALATVISNTAVIPLQLVLLGRLGLTPSKLILLHATTVKAIRLGLPVVAERLLFALGNNIYAGVIARLGETAMAAHNVGLRVESLIYMPGFAFSLTASNIVGRRLGSANLEEAKKTGWRVIKLGALIMGTLGVLLGLTGYYLVAPLSPSEEIRRLASIYLLLAGFSEGGLGLAMVASGALRGAGNTKIPFYVGVSSLFLVRVTLSLILANPLGPLGPWLAMFLDVYARGAVLAVIYVKYFNKLSRLVIH
jgi:putative MATE family efflux protein